MKESSGYARTKILSVFSVEGEEKGPYVSPLYYEA